MQDREVLLTNRSEEKMYGTGRNTMKGNQDNKLNHRDKKTEGKQAGKRMRRQQIYFFK